MNRKTTLAGLAGIAFFIGCGGTANKLGGETQANENAGGNAGSGSPGTGGVAGEPSGQGGDPFAQGGRAPDGTPVTGGVVGIGGDPFAQGGRSPDGTAGGQVGGSVGTGGTTGFGGLHGTGGQTEPPQPGPQGTPGIAVSGGADGGLSGADFVHTWSGYVENGQFPSGSDALLLSIERVSGTELSGHLTMGQGSGSLPDPASLTGVGGSPGYDPIEGYAYTALNGKATGERLEFDVAAAEAWDPVCATLAPTGNGYSCLPPGDSYGASPGACWVMHGDTQEPIDCKLMAMCSGGPCKCDGVRCFADLSMWVAHFDVTLRTPHLDGSVAGLQFTLNNVHFTQQ